MGLGKTNKSREAKLFRLFRKKTKVTFYYWTKIYYVKMNIQSNLISNNTLISDTYCFGAGINLRLFVTAWRLSLCRSWGNLVLGS